MFIKTAGPFFHRLIYVSQLMQSPKQLFFSKLLWFKPSVFKQNICKVSHIDIILNKYNRHNTNKGKETELLAATFFHGTILISQCIKRVVQETSVLYCFHIKPADSKEKTFKDLKGHEGTFVQNYYLQINQGVSYSF